MSKIIKLPLVLVVGLLIVAPLTAVGQPPPYTFNAGAGSHLVISPPTPPPPGTTPTPRMFVIHILPLEGQPEPEQVIYICGKGNGSSTIVPTPGTGAVQRLLTDAPSGRVNALHGKYGMWVQLAPQNCTDPMPNYLTGANLIRTDNNPGIGSTWTFDGGANTVVVIGVEDGSAGNGLSAFRSQDCDCSPSYQGRPRQKK